MQTLHTKGPKRTLRYCAKCCTFAAQNEKYVEEVNNEKHLLSPGMDMW